MTSKMVVVFDVATGNIDSVEGFDSNGRKHEVAPMPSKLASFFIFLDQTI